jgi:N-acetylneuraminate synthase
MHLSALTILRSRYDVPVGLSDHSMTSTAAIAAVALGATLIEKHICLSRAMGGPDSHFSLEPDEFAAFVRDVRTAECAIGGPTFELAPAEVENRAFRRSLFVVTDVAAGEEFGPHNVRSIRPSGGLPPKRLPEVLGRRATRAITRGTPLTEDLVRW